MNNTSDLNSNSHNLNKQKNPKSSKTNKKEGIFIAGAVVAGVVAGINLLEKILNARQANERESLDRSMRCKNQ